MDEDEEEEYVCVVCGYEEGANPEDEVEIEMDPDDDWLNPKKDDTN